MAKSLQLTKASSQWVAVQNNLGITGGNITIAAWIYIASNQSGAQWGIFDQANTTTNVIYHIDLQSTNDLTFRRMRENTNGTTISVDQNLSLETWYHVALTYDGTNLRGYVNGSLVGGPTAASGNGSANACDNHFLIGTLENNGTTTFAPNTASCFDGLIDQVIVFNADIGATRVADLYNTPCSPDLTNAVARYSLDDVWTDSIGGFTLDQSNGTPGFSSTVAYTCPVGPANLKTWNGVATASIKTMNGVAMANVKTWNGVI